MDILQILLEEPQDFEQLQESHAVSAEGLHVVTLILRLKEKVVVKKLWMRWAFCSERKWLSEEKVHERKFLLRDLLCSGLVQVWCNPA